jgi:hypothetical protein
MRAKRNVLGTHATQTCRDIVDGNNTSTTRRSFLYSQSIRYETTNYVRMANVLRQDASHE